MLVVPVTVKQPSSFKRVLDERIVLIVALADVVIFAAIVLVLKRKAWQLAPLLSSSLHGQISSFRDPNFEKVSWP
jgi:hypothetical protein